MGVDLNKLNPSALKAAIAGGTEAWGQAASIRDARYSQPVRPASRRRCHCGCKKRATHLGMAKGISLITGCELSVARWVRDPVAAFKQRKAMRP